MANPFEDESASYTVLINEERQHSLWPERIAVPAGWEVAFGPDSRAKCIAYVEESWTDMRPASLVREMDSLRS